MNIRDLHYIIALADTLHFGDAARLCHVSQPTLSGQIKKLESELDVVLFERSNRSVAITPVGQQMLVHARLIVEQANTIIQLAKAQQDPVAGPLRVGAIPTLSPYLMPLILIPLIQQLPQLKLILSEELTEHLVQRLLRHEIDAALLATDIDEPDLVSIPLFDEPFWVAYAHDHAFYAREKIGLRDLENENVLLLADGHCLAQQAMHVCHISERAQQGDMADLRAASLETLIQLVGAGFGVTLVPALAMQGSWTSGSGVVAQRLRAKDAKRRVCLVHRRSFPRQAALTALSNIILSNLPNTVSKLSRRSNKNRPDKQKR